MSSYILEWLVSFMQVLAIRTQIFKPGDNLVSVVVKYLRERNIELRDGDILAISSKAVASVEKRIVSLREIQPSKRARELANKYSLEPEFAELVLRESQKIYGGVHKSILTLKNGILTVNAGVDNKNIPVGYAALWPLNPQSRADKIRKEIKQQTGKSIGIVIVDSQVVPLRMGTRGLALAASGFNPIEDCRDREDLFQKTLAITRHSIADDLASAAHLLMGETDEQTPIILIRDAPVTFTEVANEEEMKISPEECVYINSFFPQQDYCTKNMWSFLVAMTDIVEVIHFILKNKFSNAINSKRLNKTQSYVCSKIRHLKSLFSSTVNEKHKNLCVITEKRLLLIF